MIIEERLKKPFMSPPAAQARQAQPSPLAQQLEFVGKLAATMLVGQMNGGLGDDVALVFDVLSQLLGDGRQLRISLAMASAIGGDAQPARDLLADGMEGWPNAEAARVSAAMALKLAGDPQWIQVCEHTLAVSSDNDARLCARQLLAQIDTS